MDNLLSVLETLVRMSYTTAVHTKYNSYGCGKCDHMIRDCPKACCFRSGEQGHTAVDCWDFGNSF